MSVVAAQALVLVLAAWFAFGVLVALVYAFGGAKRIDPDAAAMTWGARLIVLPGVVALWPLMLVKLFTQSAPPPQ